MRPSSDAPNPEAPPPETEYLKQNLRHCCGGKPSSTVSVSSTGEKCPDHDSCGLFSTRSLSLRRARSLQVSDGDSDPTSDRSRDVTERRGRAQRGAVQPVCGHLVCRLLLEKKQKTHHIQLAASRS